MLWLVVYFGPLLIVWPLHKRNAPQKVQMVVVILAYVFMYFIMRPAAALVDNIHCGRVAQHRCSPPDDEDE